MLIPTHLELNNRLAAAGWVLMPLRASCSFQQICRPILRYGRAIRLNAPQGFMLIPTRKKKRLRQPILSLNAPQGFMLIPTLMNFHLQANDFMSLNAPQGFMLIPTAVLQTK